MQSKNVLITGATGNVGHALLKKLTNEDNINIFAAGRHVEKTKDVVGVDNINYRCLDFKDKNTYESSMQDIDIIFLMRPPAISKVKRYIKPYLVKIKEKNIKQVVFLSLQGADKNILVPHHRIEKYIKDLEIPYTFLRPSFFMQNLSTTHQEEIKKRHEIYISAGKGQTNFIDIRDIAEVAKIVILEKGHINNAYELTGPENLDYYQIADKMSEILDKDIEYKDPSIWQFYKQKRKAGYSLMHTIVMIGLYSASKFGNEPSKSDDLNKLIDRKAITFDKFVKDNKEVWL
ncbi:MAG TPA: NmrA family NAD(P)-binding protein [Halanaerobiales bacterium]|nr:NmrA family NAD(P)-binding protein [Halanaerobiales bacterium]